MGRKSRLFAHSLSYLDGLSSKLRPQSLKVSGLFREYSRFAETVGGDWLITTAARGRQSVSASDRTTPNHQERQKGFGRSPLVVAEPMRGAARSSKPRWQPRALPDRPEAGIINGPLRTRLRYWLATQGHPADGSSETQTDPRPPTAIQCGARYSHMNEAHRKNETGQAIRGDWGQRRILQPFDKRECLSLKGGRGYRRKIGIDPAQLVRGTWLGAADWRRCMVRQQSRAGHVSGWRRESPAGVSLG
jgi:hypothetical protein